MVDNQQHNLGSQSHNWEQWAAELAGWKRHPVTRLLLKQWGLKNQLVLKRLVDGSLDLLTDEAIARELVATSREVTLRNEFIELSVDDVLDLYEEVGDEY